MTKAPFQIEIYRGRQITAARALAEMSLAELADAAGVTVRTVHRIETSGEVRVSPVLRHGHVSRATWDAITGVLKARGVILLDDDGKRGAGVCWEKARAGRGSDC